jgi:AraC-like DNA-binding protein
MTGAVENAGAAKLASRTIAVGAGWRAADVRCHAGPADRPFEERHEEACIAVVLEGTFHCRSPLGSALFAPGSILLGNGGTCFTCGHEHGTGDRSLAFHYAPARLEAIVAAVPGARRLDFAVPRLAPTPALAGLVASAEAARDEADPAALEEVALELAAAAAGAGTDGAASAVGPGGRDVARVTRALRRIEAAAEEALSLDDLASEAAMSPYHFLRSFRRVAGMTPHQYVLRTRLHRAAVRLRRTSDAVSAIAFDAGFNDLSTFNRRFRRVMGLSPGGFRRRFLRC